jgi:hypothetical protein
MLVIGLYRLTTPVFLSAVVTLQITPLYRIIMVRNQLAHKILKCEPALLEHTCFSILTCNYIFGPKCCSGSDHNPLFTRRCLISLSTCTFSDLRNESHRIKAKMALPLCLEHNGTQNINCSQAVTSPSWGKMMPRTLNSPVTMFL